jgi:hypothetical protein
MIEETVFRVMELPEGTDYLPYPELNVVVLSDRLDCKGRLRAVEECQAQWRRRHLHLVLESA